MSEIAEFHDVRFPAAVSFGATGGPMRRTEIVTMTSGREIRNARHAQSRRRFDVGTGVRSVDDLSVILAFFEARRGALHSFRFRDPFDWKSAGPNGDPTAADQAIGTGDGIRTQFQLSKRYGDTDDAYERPIRKPVADSVRVAVAGTEIAPTAFTIDEAKGVIEFAAPPAPGASVTAGFGFDIEARFDVEHLNLSLTAFRAGQIPSIPIVEIVR